MMGKEKLPEISCYILEITVRKALKAIAQKTTMKKINQIRYTRDGWTV